MIVNKVITTTEKQELEFSGATLLSIEEYNKYKTRIPTVNYWWWLRSPNSTRYDIAYVDLDGSVDCYSYYVKCGYGGVRPVLKIKNLKSSNLKVGDEFTITDVKFTVISEEYAITNDIICCRSFDERMNDYEKSEIKQFVDEWYNIIRKKEKEK